MIYADTSALVKLFVTEAESATLRTWLRARRPDPLVTSILGEVELRRFAARVGPTALGEVDAFLGLVDRLPLSPEAIGLASRLAPSTLRTLDALHLASAAGLPHLTALVTYDHRMLEAAATYGLPVESPV